MECHPRALITAQLIIPSLAFINFGYLSSTEVAGISTITGAVADLPFGTGGTFFGGLISSAKDLFL